MILEKIESVSSDRVFDLGVYIHTCHRPIFLAGAARAEHTIVVAKNVWAHLVYDHNIPYK